MHRRHIVTSYIIDHRGTEMRQAPAVMHSTQLQLLAVAVSAADTDDGRQRADTVRAAFNERRRRKDDQSRAQRGLGSNSGGRRA